MEYVERKIDKSLSEWKNKEHRKPLLLRGARQVGKSSSVRELAKQFDYFLEVNFERDDHELNVKEVFKKGLHPGRICDELSVIYDTPVIAGRTLLFFDEIQSCVEAISALRFFYEDAPEIHVIAAGSLLEFALQELPSLGVGRVHSLYMYPFSFDEYLRAGKKSLLADAVLNASPESPLSDVLHKNALQQLLTFVLTGGMPEVVAQYSQGVSLLECMNILNDLTFSFYDDFAKYKSKFSTALLREVFGSVIHQTGGKFTYSGVSKTAYHAQIKESIRLLELAGLIIPVIHTSGNGIPPAAEMDPKYKKQLILDTGVYRRYLRLNLSEMLNADRLIVVNKGALAELFAGLELQKSAPNNQPEQLYCRHREKTGSNAEVDYVVQCGEHIVPVEVKSGTKGSMQSMFRFLEEKSSPYGVRISLENFATYDKIRVYPLYATGNVLIHN
ncbi:MAG: AAA family ATPase [Tannerella sp.]|jgi:predicted AAA+ superfamily ATPase|nr:AAA family ATPase [Tannerella sp.]